MLFRGFNEHDLRHLNRGTMPSGQNVVRMVHCTQLQHVKPTGGIFKHGLKTRKQLRMQVKPWQSWLGGGDERYLGRASRRLSRRRRAA